MHIEYKKEHIVITHSSFSLVTTSSIGCKLSLGVDYPVVTLSGFDEGAFQVCVYKGGNKIFCHQIGDELEDFELNKQKGNALILEQILGAPKDKVAFIINETEDVLSSEDYAFDLFDIK